MKFLLHSKVFNFTMISSEQGYAVIEKITIHFANITGSNAKLSTAPEGAPQDYKNSTNISANYSRVESVSAEASKSSRTGTCVWGNFRILDLILTFALYLEYNSCL